MASSIYHPFTVTVAWGSEGEPKTEFFFIRATTECRAVKSALTKWYRTFGKKMKPSVYKVDCFKWDLDTKNALSRPSSQGVSVSAVLV